MLFGDEHVQRYRETDGAEGHEWQPGVYTLLLTTTGRRSGTARTTPLIYGEHDGAYVIVASKGGADDHPDWYLNLVDHPEVQVQVGADDVRGHRAHGHPSEEKGEVYAHRWPRSGPTTTTTPRRPTGTSPLVLLDPHAAEGTAAPGRGRHRRPLRAPGHLRGRTLPPGTRRGPFSRSPFFFFFFFFFLTVLDE